MPVSKKNRSRRTVTLWVVPTHQVGHGVHLRGPHQQCGSAGQVLGGAIEQGYIGSSALVCHAVRVCVPRGVFDLWGSKT
jgi:hypothetical protein